ncbi:hypothetical protein KP79_PYT23344 [Mizuhopecten yessoensis]|uniref:Protein-export membrane protein SecG n=1 Tax=Mizuhopecten yessoensis TaxID=6573 RepID=A0A210PPX3_MIZYE|nr:hypothetical protein KP79_PYT23344 [Mizuhopecten yessoensis]
MNKTLILIMVPCVVMFVIIQSSQGQYGYSYPGYGGYGGSGGYGVGGYGSNGLMGDVKKGLGLFGGVMGVLLLYFLFNGTGQVAG